MPTRRRTRHPKFKLTINNETYTSYTKAARVLSLRPDTLKARYLKYGANLELLTKSPRQKNQFSELNHLVVDTRDNDELQIIHHRFNIKTNGNAITWLLNHYQFTSTQDFAKEITELPPLNRLTRKKIHFTLSKATINQLNQFLKSTNYTKVQIIRGLILYYERHH